MIQKKITSLENIEPEVDFSFINKEADIDLRKEVQRPPIAISIGVDDVAYKGVHYPLRFGTFGNISLIKGEEKSRKSFLKSLIIACAIGGNSNKYTNGLEVKGYIGNKLIFDIDTEQDKHDSFMASRRVCEIVGFYPENYKAKMLRKYSPKIRLQYLEWLFNESDYKNDLGLVCIDGFVDLVLDFNSQSESTELVSKLMKWSQERKCHIMGVLHLNPNTDKARGHLGTILQQKCESVVIIKDEGDYSEVRCQRARGKKFNNFNLKINNEWLPEIEQIGMDWK